MQYDKSIYHHLKNSVNQGDILFLPHDTVTTRGRKSRTYKYALTVVDVSSRYKETDQLSTKTSSEVISVFVRIYQRGGLQLLHVDLGKEFLGAVLPLMKKHNVKIIRGHNEIHRHQSIVKRVSQILADWLFGYQYAKEISADFKSGEQSREWVASFPSVISALNNEITRATSMKPPKTITKIYTS